MRGNFLRHRYHNAILELGCHSGYEMVNWGAVSSKDLKKRRTQLWNQGDKTAQPITLVVIRPTMKQSKFNK